MAKAGYSAAAGAAVALVAATAKSVLGFTAPATFGCELLGYEIGFDGALSTAVPVLVEVCYSTFATNPPGTASTSATVNQDYGRAITAGFTAAYNWTTEPTVLTALHKFNEPAFNGLVVREFGQLLRPDSAVSNGFVLRITAPAGLNVTPTLHFERC